jgi:hypothetical protein
MKHRLFFSLALAAAALMLSGCAAANESEPASESQAEAGFRPLFDGETLDGWKLVAGQGEGYVVRDGMIVVPSQNSGGNLFYDQEFADFIVRFEFRLEPGANNGLCIRCPMQEGSLAYDGSEIQILDHHHERYANIEPWQRHGSLYHVFPAKDEGLKPAGEWNEQEVTVHGRHVKVVLNGYTILDVNLDDVTDPEILEKHPGLQRTSGYIGFLGHNEPLQFRNIRIKEL